MDCQDFFAQFKGSKQMCKELMLMSQAQVLGWERQPCSVHSPGPVVDEEILYQQILTPTNLTQDLTALDPMAFDTASGVGMSVNRLAHSSVEDLTKLGSARALNFNEKFPSSPQRAMWGFVPVKAEQVRSILSSHSGERGFCIFDTARLDDRSHADICQIVKEPKGVRGVRFKLYELVRGAVIKL